MDPINGYKLSIVGPDGVILGSLPLGFKIDVSGVPCLTAGTHKGSAPITINGAPWYAVATLRAPKLADKATRKAYREAKLSAMVEAEIARRNLVPKS